MVGDFNSILVAKDIFDLDKIYYIITPIKDDKEIDTDYISEPDLKLTKKFQSLFNDEKNNY